MSNMKIPNLFHILLGVFLIHKVIILMTKPGYTATNMTILSKETQRKTTMIPTSKSSSIIVLHNGFIACLFILNQIPR